MKITQILKKPIITEKSYKMMELNQYVFSVDMNATKPMIKNAFELIFDKKVESVNLIKGKAKKKRVGRFIGKKKRIKKAIITLKKGEIFSLFDEEQTKKIQESQKPLSISKTKITSETKDITKKSGISNKFKSYWKSFTTLKIDPIKKDK